MPAGHPGELQADAGPADADRVIWLLVGSAFVMILNETIILVALPAVIADLGVTVTTAQWLTSGFLLTMAVVIPVTGFLLQRFPPRAVYLAAMTLFSTGTLLAAVAPGFGVLMAARIVQACGTAVMVPLLMTSVIRLVPVQRRGAMMGTIMVVIAVAPAVGPTISGVILSVLDWRWTFWTVLPIALLALATGARRLRMAAHTQRVPLDMVSVPLSALAFGGLVWALTEVGESARGGATVSPWVPGVVGAVAMVLFVMRQLRLQHRGRALLDLRPLGHVPFVVPLVLMCLTFVALFGVIILLPLYLQDVLRAGALATGLALLPGGLAMGLLGPVVGRLYDRFGPRRLVTPGAVAATAALWAFVTLNAGSALWQLIAIHVVLMFGISFMVTPLMTDALGRLPVGLDAHGSAILTTLQQLAGAAGTALTVTVMALASAGAATGADIDGAHAAFLTAALIGTATVPLTLLAGRGDRVPEPAVP
jgi:DHA2 family lincomycin resistance protein-like MFS transporter